MSKNFGETNLRSVNLDFWLTVHPGDKNAYPRRPGARITANYPAMSRDERTINLKVQLPLALFEAPSLSASIVVEHPTQAIHIDAVSIAEAVRQVIGMDVDVSVALPEGEEAGGD